jgi:hypothetical protein
MEAVIIKKPALKQTKDLSSLRVFLTALILIGGGIAFSLILVINNYKN